MRSFDKNITYVIHKLASLCKIAAAVNHFSSADGHTDLCKSSSNQSRGIPLNYKKQ